MQTIEGTEGKKKHHRVASTIYETAPVQIGLWLFFSIDFHMYYFSVFFLKLLFRFSDALYSCAFNCLHVLPKLDICQTCGNLSSNLNVLWQKRKHVLCVISISGNIWVAVTQVVEQVVH